MLERIVRGLAVCAVFTPAVHCFYHVGAVEPGSRDAGLAEAGARDGDVDASTLVSLEGGTSFCNPTCEGPLVDAGLDGEVDAAVVAPPPPTVGLVLHLPFDDDANDRSPARVACAARNGAAPAAARPGRSGQAYAFDGVGAYVECPAALPTGRTPRTVSFWFASRVGLNDHWNTIVDWGRNESRERFAAALRYGQYAFSAQGSDYDFYSPRSGNDGMWHHLVVRYDGTVVSLVVDATPAGELALAVATAAGPLRVGRKVGSTEYFAGSVDDVRIYDRALSAAEISALFREN